MESQYRSEKSNPRIFVLLNDKLYYLFFFQFQLHSTDFVEAQQLKLRLDESEQISQANTTLSSHYFQPNANRTSVTVPVSTTPVTTTPTALLFLAGTPLTTIATTVATISSKTTKTAAVFSVSAEHSITKAGSESTLSANLVYETTSESFKLEETSNLALYIGIGVGVGIIIVSLVAVVWVIFL